MANIQQIKVNENNFVTSFLILQELLPNYIECEVTADMGGVMGRKYDRETNTFLDEWLEGYEPKPEELTEAEQMQIETYLNTAFIADMMALNM